MPPARTQLERGTASPAPAPGGPVARGLIEELHLTDLRTGNQARRAASGAGATGSSPSPDTLISGAPDVTDDHCQALEVCQNHQPHSHCRMEKHLPIPLAAAVVMTKQESHHMCLQSGC